jgi:hypothetical protein
MCRDVHRTVDGAGKRVVIIAKIPERNESSAFPSDSPAMHGSSGAVVVTQPLKKV